MGLHNRQEEEQESLAKKLVKGQAKKQGKKLVKKLGKKAAKQLALHLAKLLLSFLGGIGLPVILFGIVVIFLIMIISLSFTFFFSTGSDLEGEELAIYEYIVEQADKTVDMGDPVQKKYRVPHALITSVIQLDAFSDKEEKKIAKEMAESLAPTFDYGKYNEYSEKQTQVCEDNVCKPWGKIKKTDNWLHKLDNVDYWNGYTNVTHTPYITDWKYDTKITYRTDRWTETEYYTEKVLETYTEYVEVSRTVYTEVPYTVIINEAYTVKEYDYIEKAPGIYITIERLVTKYRKKEVTRYENKKVIITEMVPVEKNKETLVNRTKEVEKSKQVEIKTTTRTRKQQFNSTENSTEDYSYLDQILNSYNFGQLDKRMVEVNYLFVDGNIAYTDWLCINRDNGFLGGFGGGFNGTIMPGAGVPAEYMEYYLAAEKKYGVDWYTIAGLHFVETGFGTHPTKISTAGAIGDFQFLEASWVGWKYDIGGGRVSTSLDITSLSVIKSGNGFGVDGDNDGKADPWNVVDGIFSAANYLARSGYAKDPRAAIFNYNHATWYVDKVMTAALGYKSGAVYTPAEGDMPTMTKGDFMSPTVGTISSGYGERWGELHAGIDIVSNKGAVPIVAVADGVVVRSYLSNSYGNCVILQHTIDGVKYETLYAHMTGRAVSNGQTVQKGQLLGNMGNTGKSTGKHLHFELHKGSWNIKKSNSLDPVLYVPLSK